MGSETHDNFLRDLLRAFLASPHDCHRIVDQWKPCPYLSSKVKLVEYDDVGGGKRSLVHVGKMDLPATTEYGKELFKRRNIAPGSRLRKGVTSNEADTGYVVSRPAVQPSYAYVCSPRESGHISYGSTDNPRAPGFARGAVYPNGFNAT